MENSHKRSHPIPSSKKNGAKWKPHPRKPAHHPKKTTYKPKLEKKRTKQTILITGPSADFDTLGGLLAATKLQERYHTIGILWLGTTDEMIQNAVRELELPGIAWYWNYDEIPSSFLIQLTKLIIVDTKKSSRLNHIHKLLEKKKENENSLEIWIFDHHPETKGDILADQIILLPSASVTSVVMHEIIRKKNENIAAITPKEATIIGMGIYTQTGCFTYGNTTKWDFEAVTYLMQRGLHVKTISHYLHLHNKDFNLSKEEYDLYQQLAETTKKHTIKGVDIFITEISLENSRDALEEVLKAFIRNQNFSVLFCLGKFPDHVDLLGRSKRENPLDIGKICKYFGGSGDKTYGNAFSLNLTPTQVNDELFAIIVSELNEETVEHIMTKPAVSLSMNKSIDEAYKLMLNFNLKKLPVTTSSGECVGIVDRIASEKAMAHGLAQLSIDHIMDTEFSTLSVHSPLESAIELILRKLQRMIPITKDGKILGVLSRSDIINLMLREPSRFPSLLQQREEKNLNELMQTRVESDIYELLKEIGRLADKEKLLVYVVGGFVRDLFLNRPNDDVDIVVEGDGLAFADIINKHMGKKVQHHHDFKTAVVTLKSGLKIDVATARLEYYPMPVSLPTVELSCLKMDLYRRDFTINAMALQLNGAHFGRLIDFFNSEEDLRNKKIKVLHSLSFIEDPTRAFRCVRFEQRYGFSIGKQTEKLILNAVELHIFDKLSGSRLFHELVKIFEDKHPIQCVQRAEELQLLKIIQPNLCFSPEPLERISKILDFYDSLGLKERPVRWKLFFLAFLENLSEKEKNDVMSRLGLSDNGVKKDMNNLFTKSKQVGLQFDEWLRKGNTSNLSFIYNIFKGFPLEGVLYLTSRRPKDQRPFLSSYLTHLQYQKAPITGKDLMDMGYQPGPNFSVVLKKVFEAKLDGVVGESKEVQLNYAKKLLTQLSEKN